MEEQHKLAPGDTYSIPTIVRRREKLRGAITGTISYKVPPVPDYMWGAELHELMPALAPIFASVLNISMSVVEQSLWNLLGRLNDGCPSLEDVRRIAWVMAGNQRTLDMDVPVEPFTGVTRAEWVPAVVGDSKKTFRNGTKGYFFDFKVIGGTPTSEMISMYFTGRAASSLLRIAAGLPWSAYTFNHFVGMRTWAYLDPLVSQERGRPSITHMECNGPFKAMNRKLNSARKNTCKLGLNRICSNCPNGLDVCWRGMHSKTYTVGTCVRCKNEGAFFIGEPKGLCISCADNKRISMLRKRSK